MFINVSRHGRYADSRRNRGAALPIILAGVVIVCMLIGGFVLVQNGGTAEAAQMSGDTFVVRKGDFNVTVPVSGELESLENVEIVNPLEVRSVITYIIDEGVTVEEGDVLLRLADDEIIERIEETQLQVLNAENSVASAVKQIEIQKSANESELSQAKLRVQLAELALEEWRQGTLEARKLELDLEIETAEKDLERARIKYEEARNLVAKEFISEDEYRQDEIDFLRAQSRVKTSRLAKNVYLNYEMKRQEATMLSDVEQAKEELERVQARHEAGLDQMEKDLETRRGELEIRQKRLAELQRQLKQCVVRAPSGGLVVYETSMENDRHDDDPPPQVGTELRENEDVIFLPDMTKIIASVQVHESLSGRIDPGQYVEVICDSRKNTVLRGEVMSVGVLASTGGWRDPNRRDYTVRVKLFNTEGLGLKPSMRCTAEIFLERVEDANYVPIQSVFRKGPQMFVYTPAVGGYAETPVRIDRTSELYAEVTEGLEEGDRVLVREPAAEEIVSIIKGEERTSAFGPAGMPSEDEPAEGDEAGENDPRDGSSDARGGAGTGIAGRMGSPDQFISQFDADRDGKLQESELPERMQSMFDRLDENGDGAVSADEMEASFNRMRERGNRGGERDGFDRNDDDRGDPANDPRDDQDDQGDHHDSALQDEEA